MNDLSFPAGAAKVPLTRNRLSPWRKAKDKLADVTITVGGMGVLFAILLIFFYLLYEIIPLFTPASIDQTATYKLPGGAPLYLGMDEQAEIGAQLTRDGKFVFFRTDNGQPVGREQLPLAGKSISGLALNSEQQPLLAVSSGTGAVLLVEPVYRSSYPEGKRVITPDLEYPYGKDPIKLADEAVHSVALRNTDEQLVLVAATDSGLVGRRFVKQEDFLSGDVSLEEEDLSLQPIDIAADWLLIGPNQRWLYVVSRSGEFRVLDLNNDQVADSGKLLDTGKVTDVRFLLGEISLMVADDRGRVAQWFMVSESGKAPRLEHIRSFQDGGGAIRELVVEHRRKGFLTVNADNDLDIYYSTSHRHLLRASMGQGDAVQRAAVAPRANALLTKLASGKTVFWHLENEHPEVSWSALWNKVWYESYSKPEYIWQSSAANNDFEPKYSFTPLAFGTLKAAFYAMLIATPLAICGAIYTAYFMSTAIRRKVKPLIELMEALPTVILGFLAGLWLAPFFERNLAGVFSVFLIMPVGVLAFGYGWSLLPARLRQTVPEGWHPVLLIPVVVLVVWGSVAASTHLELWFFNGDMRAWLTHDLGISFDQRNALVVGVAMGFAVVPTIFSIAEDAIFSVPKSLSYGSLALGATPWQSLVGVVLPTASPGIFSALMIGMGRAVGETMIVLMATGNTPVMDINIFEGMRTLAANIAVEIGETEVRSTHYHVLFLAAFVLFLFTFVVNTVAEIVRQRLRRKYSSL